MKKKNMMYGGLGVAAISGAAALYYANNKNFQRKANKLVNKAGDTAAKQMNKMTK